MDPCEGYVSKESVLDVFAQWHGHDVCDFNRAIKELPSVNPTEQEAYDKGYKQGYADRIEMEKALRVEDCISIKDAINAIYGLHTGGKEAVEQESVFDHYSEALNDAVYAIEELPSVKPTRAKGHWIEHEKVFECSECQIIRAKGTTGKYNYCPSCGARMDGEEE